MREWIVYLKMTQLEMEAQDENIVISRQVASKLLRGASVAPEKESQVLFNSGCVLDPDHVETVLRVVFQEMPKIEKCAGHAVPSTNQVSHSRVELSVQEDWRCEVPLRHNSLLDGVPSRRRRISGR